jgi:diguanylate cyclase (GGDEF)-like protein
MRVIDRLRSDYELGILTSFGACAVVGILPFAFYRFATGNPAAGLLDVAIVAAICTAVWRTWQVADRSRPKAFLALVNIAGCLASANLLGPPGLFWMYPALLGNFLLLRPSMAVAATTFALTFLAVQGRAWDSLGQLAMFLVSASVSALVAYVFAARNDSQRVALEALATMDSLTGLPNRRAMVRELEVAVQQHRRDGIGFGLAMLDLDHFKAVNDLHGHEAGDGVLVEFARLVNRSVRKGDRCFRFGGEEFVLLMPASGVADLRAIDASLRRRVAEELRCREQCVTVSIGAAALRPDEDWQAWLGRADAALYRAKTAGRDRTLIDEDVIPAAAGARATDRPEPAAAAG